MQKLSWPSQCRSLRSLGRSPPGSPSGCEARFSAMPVLLARRAAGPQGSPHDRSVDARPRYLMEALVKKSRNHTREARVARQRAPTALDRVAFEPGRAVLRGVVRRRPEQAAHPALSALVAPNKEADDRPDRPIIDSAEQP